MHCLIIGKLEISLVLATSPLDVAIDPENTQLHGIALLPLAELTWILCSSISSSNKIE